MDTDTLETSVSKTIWLCPDEDCEFEAKAKAGLGAHTAWKHGIRTDGSPAAKRKKRNRVKATKTSGKVEKKKKRQSVKVVFTVGSNTVTVWMPVQRTRDILKDYPEETYNALI